MKDEGQQAAEIALDETVVASADGGARARIKRVDVEAMTEPPQSLEGLVDQLRVECELEAAADSKYEVGLKSAGLAAPVSTDLGSLLIEPTLSIGEIARANLRRHFGPGSSANQPRGSARTSSKCTNCESQHVGSTRAWDCSRHICRRPSHAHVPPGRRWYERWGRCVISMCSSGSSTGLRRSSTRSIGNGWRRCAAESMPNVSTPGRGCWPCSTGMQRDAWWSGCERLSSSPTGWRSGVITRRRPSSRQN